MRCSTNVRSTRAGKSGARVSRRPFEGRGVNPDDWIEDEDRLHHAQAEPSLRRGLLAATQAARSNLVGDLIFTHSLRRLRRTSPDGAGAMDLPKLSSPRAKDVTAGESSAS